MRRSRQWRARLRYLRRSSAKKSSLRRQRRRQSHRLLPAEEFLSDLILRPPLLPEQIRAQIVFAFICENSNNNMAFPQTLGHLERGTTSGARRNANEKTFF